MREKAAFFAQPRIVEGAHAGDCAWLRTLLVASVRMGVAYQRISVSAYYTLRRMLCGVFATYLHIWVCAAYARVSVSSSVRRMYVCP